MQSFCFVYYIRLKIMFILIHVCIIHMRQRDPEKVGDASNTYRRNTLKPHHAKL
jgi:hypothetical protein